MTAILSLLMGRFGGWIVGGLALALTFGVMTVRLNHVEHQRDRARMAALSAHLSYVQAVSNRIVLQAGIDRQNAAVAAQGAESARRLRASEEALEAAQRGRRSLERRLAVLSRPAVGDTACERAESARQQVIESLR